MPAEALGHPENNTFTSVIIISKKKLWRAPGRSLLSLSLEMASSHHNERMATGSQVIGPSAHKHGRKLSRRAVCVSEPRLNNPERMGRSRDERQMFEENIAK